MLHDALLPRQPPPGEPRPREGAVFSAPSRSRLAGRTIRDPLRDPQEDVFPGPDLLSLSILQRKPFFSSIPAIHAVLDLVHQIHLPSCRLSSARPRPRRGARRVSLLRCSSRWPPPLVTMAAAPGVWPSARLRRESLPRSMMPYLVLQISPARSDMAGPRMVLPSARSSLSSPLHRRSGALVETLAGSSTAIPAVRAAAPRWPAAASCRATGSSPGRRVVSEVAPDRAPARDFLASSAPIEAVGVANKSQGFDDLHVVVKRREFRHAPSAGGCPLAPL